MNKQDTPSSPAPVNRLVGRLFVEQILPIGCKIEDKCPHCAASGHTGIWDPIKRINMVCKVCGDKGVIDEMSIIMYGEPPNAKDQPAGALPVREA